VGKKISYVNIPEEAARKGMKEVGMDDWFINSMIELYAIVRGGYGSNLSSDAEELTGRKPISFFTVHKRLRRFFQVAQLDLII
jgi:hypothetical protein